MGDERFWLALDELVASHRLVIEYAQGTLDPAEPESIYPLDYGYLEGTTSSDGEGIDVWVGTLQTRRVTAVVCTVDRLKGDVEVKLLVGGTESEAEQIYSVHQRGFQSAFLLLRSDSR